MTKLNRLEADAASLPLPELRRLVRRLQDKIVVHQVEAEDATRTTAHQTVAVRQQEPGVTLKQEKVRCGKKNCRCATGELHGPYWYKYWNEGGRTRSQYIGKHLPATATPATLAAGTATQLPAK